MNLDTSSFMANQWIVGILVNFITALILWTAKRGSSYGKRLTAASIEKLKSSSAWAVTKYTLFVGMGVVPVAYNGWWLYKLLSPPTSPSRIDVLAIFFAFATIIYWLHNMVSKFRCYSIADYIDSDN
jgi:hypothetical protein